MLARHFHLEPEDCKFVVDKANQRVICYLEGTQYMFEDFCNMNSRVTTTCDYDYNWRNNVNAENSFVTKLRMPNKFVAVAKCNPEDTWDEQIGRAVAFSRLKDKVVKSFFKRAYTYFHFIEKTLDNFENKLTTLQEDLANNKEKREQYIKQLIENK